LTVATRILPAYRCALDVNGKAICWPYSKLMGRIARAF